MDKACTGKFGTQGKRIGTCRGCEKLAAHQDYIYGRIKSVEYVSPTKCEIGGEAPNKKYIINSINARKSKRQ